jgi:RimJ/RimL family protein N-acetyltransferase
MTAYCHPHNYAAHLIAKKVGFIPKGINQRKNSGNERELFVYARNS